MEDAIRAAGWEQGSLLRDVGDAFLFAPALPISSEAQSASEELASSAIGISATVREPGEDQLSILITHTCDIVKAPKRYPRLEVLRCYVEENPDILRSANSNSARYFLVDPEQRLVADVCTRTSIEKGVLFTREPIGWPSSRDRLERFRNWLGSRYYRPIEPDEIALVLHRPITNRVREIKRRNIDHLSETLDMVKRIHILRKNDSEPYDITLVFFVEEERLEQSRERVDRLVEDFREHLSPDQVVLDHHITTEAQISLKDYLATTYFDLDYYSFRGEDEGIAQPISGV